jgi:amino acid permease
LTTPPALTHTNNMFNKLTDFGYNRTGKEAFGFYIAYLLFVILAGAVVGGLLGSLIPDAAYQNGFKVGTYVSVITALVLSYLILDRKKLAKDYTSILLILAAGLLGMFGGSLFGLIIPAYLTTKKHTEKKHTEKKEKPKILAKRKK